MRGSLRSKLLGISCFLTYGRHFEPIIYSDRNYSGIREQRWRRKHDRGAKTRTTGDLCFGVSIRCVRYGTGGKNATSKVSDAAGHCWRSLVLRQLRHQRREDYGCARHISGDGDRCIERHQCSQSLDDNYPDGEITTHQEPFQATLGWPEVFVRQMETWKCASFLRTR